MKQDFMTASDAFSAAVESIIVARYEENNLSPLIQLHILMYNCKKWKHNKKWKKKIIIAWGYVLKNDIKWK